MTHKALFIVLVTAALFIAFNYQASPSSPPAALDLNCGFTDHFSTFLKEKGYGAWNFQRNDLKCASFGGRTAEDDKIVRTPVIFLHGNGDIGFGRGKADGYEAFQTGFRELATYLGTQGYQKAELYTTTWGTGKIDEASLNNHKKRYVLMLRAFVEAVLAYTGASQVSIVSHSMGVTLARKVVKGGSAQDHTEGTYEVGPSLHTRVKAFVGIAGGNLGLTNCNGMSVVPTCSDIDGFHPGLTIVSGPSKYLSELNRAGGAEGTSVYAIWSKYDEVVMYECVVWGKITCRIPGQQGEVVKNSLEWTHMNLRDKTGPDMITWL